MVDQVAKNLDLNPNRFCLLGALLGNHILPPSDLTTFHQQLAPEDSKNKVKYSGGSITGTPNYHKHLIDHQTITVVYFDQLLGAARTQKLVKILFSVVFNLFCSFQTFFSYKASSNCISKLYLIGKW